MCKLFVSVERGGQEIGSLGQSSDHDKVRDSYVLCGGAPTYRQYTPDCAPLKLRHRIQLYHVEECHLGNTRFIFS